jgi:hypothetical protein
MADQIIDVVAARKLHTEAHQNRALVGWVVMNDPPDHPGKFIARLVIGIPSGYLLLADTLGGIREQLPHGLVRSDRQPVDPPEVVEIWLAD